jgi:hypothetical protein
MNTYMVIGEYGNQEGDRIELLLKAKNETNATKNFLKRVRSGEFGYINIDHMDINVEKVSK